MYLKIEQKSEHELFSTPLLQQTAFWSSVKKSLGFNPKAFNLWARQRDILDIAGASSAYVMDDVLVLEHPVGIDKTIAYVPYGPLLCPSESAQGVFLENLSEALREKLSRSCILIRYDLPWKREEEQGSQTIRMNWGTVKHNIRPSSSGQLPTTTTILDLRSSADEILSRMHPKTRYNIRIALSKGVKVRRGTVEDLDIFMSLYEETSRRNRIQSHDRAFFQALYQSHEKDAFFELLIASLDGVDLSAMFLTLSDNRATYLYGASSDSMRNSMSTYALQYQAILDAKASGALEYDMFGIAPKDATEHKLSGLSRFKLGFGGSILDRMGCWDYTLSSQGDDYLLAEQAFSNAYHLG